MENAEADTRSGKLHALHSDALTRYLVECRRACDGDLDLFLIMFPAAILAGFVAPKIAKRLNPLHVKRVAVVGLTILGLSLVGVF